MKKKTLALVMLIPLLATTQMAAELVRIPSLDGRTPIVYEHYQVLDIGYHKGCAAPDIVDSPQDQKVICHTGDFHSITVKRVLVYPAVYIEDERYFLEVSLPTGKTGYIKISVNPYGSVVLSRDAREWALEEFGQPVWAFKYPPAVFVARGTIVREAPFSSAKSVGRINTSDQGSTLYEVLYVTEDEKWAAIRTSQGEGWVPASSLDAGRGGPLLPLPDSIIAFEVIGA